MKKVTVKIEVPFDTTKPLANQIMRYIDRFHNIEMPVMNEFNDSEIELIDKMDRIPDGDISPFVTKSLTTRPVVGVDRQNYLF